MQLHARSDQHAALLAGMRDRGASAAIVQAATPALACGRCVSAAGIAQELLVPASASDWRSCSSCTLDLISMQQLLAGMRDRGADAATVEASTPALACGRGVSPRL